jgi:ribonuclease BN (tRNA processing enzyme)
MHYRHFMLRTIAALLLLTPAFASSLQLLVLGSGGPRPFGRACSSYILMVDGTPRVLIDAGPGAFLRIGELNVDLEKVDTILLTHLHIDHSGDLPGFFKARTLTASASSIRFAVFGPDGAGIFPSTAKFVNLLFADQGAWAYQKTFGANEDIQAVNLPIQLNTAQRTIVNKDGLRISTIATHHGDCPSVAYRVDYKTESIVFSGDMDVSALANLEHLAKNCSLLVFHCAVLDPPESPSQLYALHTPPGKIGEAAQSAGVKRLLLSHIAPDIEDARQEVLTSIRRSYKGPVEFAQDKMRTGTAVQ